MCVCVCVCARACVSARACPRARDLFMKNIENVNNKISLSVNIILMIKSGLKVDMGFPPN